jgi:hypothetical protein
MIPIFRAWDERRLTMHYDFQFIKSGDTGADWIVFTSDKQKLDDKPHPFENPYCAKQLIIMPGMSVKAQNGVLIYAGDVVMTDEAGWIGEVKFDGDSFWVGGTGFSTQCNWKAFKVLGNVYQNPELKTHLVLTLQERLDIDKWRAEMKAKRKEAKCSGTKKKK